MPRTLKVERQFDQAVQKVPNLAGGEPRIIGFSLSDNLFQIEGVVIDVAFY